jgi:hypothetical protein
MHRLITTALATVCLLLVTTRKCCLVQPAPIPCSPSFEASVTSSTGPTVTTLAYARRCNRCHSSKCQDVDPGFQISNPLAILLISMWALQAHALLSSVPCIHLDKPWTQAQALLSSVQRFDCNKPWRQPSQVDVSRTLSYIVRPTFTVLL